MIKLIRDNQKKVLAGTGVLLMITFVAGYGGNNGMGRGGKTDAEFGTVTGGKRLMQSEVAAAKAELGAVNYYARQQGSSLVDLILGRDVSANLAEHPELFALLQREAAAAGVTADPQRVQGILDTYLGGTQPDGRPIDVPTPDTDLYQTIKAGVADLLAVGQNYARVTAALKVSRPATDRMLALYGQTIQLNLIPVPADALMAQVPPPTPAQLDAQFARFAAISSDHPDPVTNPFGFGYKVPAKANLQYLRVTSDAVQKAVAATKSDYDWEVEARKYFYAHPEQFAITPPPTTAPIATVTPPTIHPPFEAVRAEALRQVQQPLIHSLQDQVQQFLTTTLSRDWQAYAAALKANTAAPATPLGPPYDAATYLPAVVNQALARYHVQVEFKETGDLSAKEMAQLPGLGTASASLATASVTATSNGLLPEYVSDRATHFTAKPDPKPPAAIAELMQPSPVFNESTGDALEIVRIVSAKESAPAPNLDSVRLAVEGDCRVAAAYELAKAQADRLSAAAHDGTMLAAALAAGRSALTSQPLSMQDVAIDGLQPPLGDAARDFMTQAFGLLDGYDPATNPHPVKVIALPTQRRLFVAQLQFLNAKWTASDHFQARLEVTAQVRKELEQLVRVDWFATDAVVQRTGFKPTAG